MNTLQYIKDFWKRRVSIPVDRRAFVLDIGSGEKPHWRADLLVDFFPEEKYAIQRGGGGKALCTSPMIVGDIQNLPLKDQSVDYVIASHILEHVPDPMKACREMERVGKAGYIELPYEGMAKILDLDTHLWWCKKSSENKDDHNLEKLIFTAKQEVMFDKSIFKYAQAVNERGIWFKEIVHKNFDISVVRYHWNKQIHIEILGKNPEDFGEKILKHAERYYRPLNTPAVWGRSFMIRVLRFIFGYRRKIASHKGMDLVIQCQICKDAENLTPTKSGYTCQKCDNKLLVTYTKK